jgi:acyl-CoA dehydrogenase
MVWRGSRSGGRGFLRRIAKEQLVLVSAGASDWLNGAGVAERVEGGWRVTGRKIFGSGVPMGDYLMTGAVYDDPDAGPTVLHFPLPVKADGVRALDTWHVMGMRATGSHDVLIEGAFVPESAVGARRPQGQWHMLLHVATLVAFPLVYSVYLGSPRRRARSRSSGRNRGSRTIRCAVCSARWSTSWRPRGWPRRTWSRPRLRPSLAGIRPIAS